MTDTPGISVGKGDHRKSRELVPAPVIWQYIVYFLVLFASRSGWLMETIAVDMPSLLFLRTQALSMVGTLVNSCNNLDWEAYSSDAVK